MKGLVAKSALKFLIDPLVAEGAVEAVRQGARGALQRRLETDFQRAAENIYSEIPQSDREEAFESLYRSLFVRLEFETLLGETAREFPLLQENLGEVVVACAKGARDEGSDLSNRRDAGPAKRAILRLQPSRLADAAAARPFLWYCWQQLSDLCDPDFGFSGQEPGGELHPTERKSLLDAYALLWSASSGARLRARGLEAPAENSGRRERLERIGARLGENALGERVGAVLTGRLWRHTELLALAESLREYLRAEGGIARVCSLCRFPSPKTYLPEEIPPGAGRDGLLSDYPVLTGAVCSHCLERYELVALGSMPLQAAS